MKQIKRRSLRLMLVAAGMGLATGLALGTSALAWTQITTPQVFTNTFTGGKLFTRFGPYSNYGAPSTFAAALKTGAQFNNEYYFNNENTDPSNVIYHPYAHQGSDVRGPSGVVYKPAELAAGTSSGLGFINVNREIFTRISNPKFEYETSANGKTKFRYTATLENYGTPAYKLAYQVITTTDDEGKILHDATVTNKGTTNLPAENLVMILDTQLDTDDKVPLYPAGGKAGYMYKTKSDGSGDPAEPRLRFDLMADGGDITHMYFGEYNNFTTTKVDIESPSLALNEKIPGLDSVDSMAIYEINSANLAPDETRHFSYSELVTLSIGKSETYDEDGRKLPSREIILNPVLPDENFEEPVFAPSIPGYRYVYAQMYVQSDPRQPDNPFDTLVAQPHLFTTTDTTNDHGVVGALGTRTTMNPVMGTGPNPSQRFKLKFFYKPIVNKDTTPNTNTSDKTPGNNNQPNTNNPTPEVDQNTGNETTVPSKVAKKGETVYAINRLGLYKGVSFTKSSRIKSYAKKSRVNRPEFIVKGYARSKNGKLRYYVQQYNPYKNKYIAGTKGYITASRKFVVPVYYKTTGNKRIKVINASGVKAYSNKQLSNYKKHYKKGATLKVKKVVKQKYATRFQLTNGLYITGNKKFVMIK